MQRGAAATLTLFPATAESLRRGYCVGPIGRAAMQAASPAEARERLGLRAEGAVVDTALCVIDREAGGGEKLAAEGIALTALFGAHELEAAAKA